ncbi:MAG: hypothetical protein K2Q01_02700 [Rickettsiales bacterium]|nr:hypothetical protein [Rickettsiales bacterium]
MTIHEELEATGLLHAGAWRMEEGELRYIITPESAAHKNIIYAFTAGENVLYISKTTKMAAKQFNAYQSPSATQSACIKTHAQLLQALQTAPQIEIFILNDEKLVKMRWMEENPATLRETALIQQFRPKWNPGKLNPEKPRAPRVTIAL